MNTNVFGHLSISWNVIAPTIVHVDVKIDNIKIVSQTLTSQIDTLKWSTQINYIESFGEIKLRHLSSDVSKYTLLTSFSYTSQIDKKVFSEEIGSWS